MLLNCRSVSAQQHKLSKQILTVERAGVDLTENALRRKQDVHGISEPVRKNEQEQVGDGERLGLEVIDLR